MTPKTSNKILFVLYPGSGETYLNYCIERFFNLELKNVSEDEAPDEDTVFYKSTSETSLGINLKDYFVIYMVRDGRDAIISQVFNAINNHKQTINKLDCLVEEATIAQDGSYFNGWSNHIKHWQHKAKLVVKFEDFINDPVSLLKDISKRFNLSHVHHGTIKKYSESEFGDHLPAIADPDKKYHTPNCWENHFSKKNKALFYKLHYSGLIKLGYENDKDIPAATKALIFDGLTDRNFYQIHNEVISNDKVHILFDASKLQMPHNDGIKRYVLELLKSFQEVVPLSNRINLDVFDGKKIYTIKEINLEPYWYIIPIKDPVLKMIKDAILNQAKEICKLILSKSVFLNLSLRYKQFKSGLKDLILSKLTKLRKKEGSGSIFSSAIYDKYDLVHVPLLQDVDFINYFKSKALVTIHDLTHITHPEFHIVDNIRLADSGLKAALKHNAGLISISKYTQKDLINQGVIDYKTPYIYEAADVQKFFPYRSKYWSDEIRTKYNIPENARFYLSLSTLEPRKNLKNSIIAFQKCISDLPEDFYFVIAGKNGWNLDEVLPENMEAKNRIIFTGFVDEDDLAWLYREAYALVYVSHYEGFGLPILEAMSCGKPVIYGNNSSMVEIGRDAGIAVDTHDVSSISNAMYFMANNKEFYLNKSDLAFGISNQFQWFKTGLLTLNHYMEKIQEKESQKCLNTNIY